MKKALLLLRSRSLITQLLVLIVFPILLTLVFISYEGISLHEHAMQTLVGDRDERAVRAAAEVLTDRFAQRRLTLKLIADRLADGIPLARILDNEPALRDAFDGGLVVADKQGNVTDAWQPGVAWSSSLRSAAAPWVVEHDTQTPLVIANAASSSGQLTLFGGISLRSLNLPGAMGVMQNAPQVRLYLVADDGHVLEDTAGTAVGTNAIDWPGITLDSLPQGLDTRTTAAHEVGDMITVASRVDQLNWTLVTQEPWQAVISPVLRWSLIAPLAMIPALFLAVFILLFGLTRVVLPLRRLGQATTRLAWGDYDSVRQPVGGVQEIRDLQATLTHMAQRLQQMQASMHSYIAAMLQGQEDERRRLSRELHDDTLQSLIALDQQRQMAQRTLAADPPKAQRHLEQLHAMIEQMSSGLRQMIRNMRPSYIEDLGLTPALEMLSAQVTEAGQARVEFVVHGTPNRLPVNHELGLYRISQESITNALRHGKATAIQLELGFDEAVTLTIRDNGQGFAVPDRPGILAQGGHYGLMGMVERVEQMHGQFRIQSSPGKGTVIEISLPLSSAAVTTSAPRSAPD